MRKNVPWDFEKVTLEVTCCAKSAEESAKGLDSQPWPVPRHRGCPEPKPVPSASRARNANFAVIQTQRYIVLGTYGNPTPHADASTRPPTWWSRRFRWGMIPRGRRHPGRETRLCHERLTTWPPTLRWGRARAMSRKAAKRRGTARSVGAGHHAACSARRLISCVTSSR